VGELDAMADAQRAMVMMGKSLWGSHSGTVLAAAIDHAGAFAERDVADRDIGVGRVVGVLQATGSVIVCAIRSPAKRAISCAE